MLRYLLRIHLVTGVKPVCWSHLMAAPSVNSPFKTMEEERFALNILGY